VPPKRRDDSFGDCAIGRYPKEGDCGADRSGQQESYQTDGPTSTITKKVEDLGIRWFLDISSSLKSFAQEELVKKVMCVGVKKVFGFFLFCGCFGFATAAT
jgi:hypothetical protein